MSPENDLKPSIVERQESEEDARERQVEDRFLRFQQIAWHNSGVALWEQAWRQVRQEERLSARGIPEHDWVFYLTCDDEAEQDSGSVYGSAEMDETGEAGRELEGSEQHEVEEDEEGINTSHDDLYGGPQRVWETPMSARRREKKTRRNEERKQRRQEERRNQSDD